MVHPKTRDLYEKAGFEYHPTTQDYVKMDFDRRTGGEEAKENKRYRVDQLYRVRQGTQDYVVYNLTTIAVDMPGNEHTVAEVVGMHDEPTFTKTYDPESGQARATAVSGTRTVYDIPATPDNIQRILDSQTEDHDTKFVLVNGTAKYGGFSREEFLTKHFDDLLHKATTGDFPAQTKPFGQQVKARTPPTPTPQNKKIVEVKKGLIAETEEDSQEEKEYEKMSKRLEQEAKIPAPTEDEVKYSREAEEEQELRTISQEREVEQEPEPTEKKTFTTRKPTSRRVSRQQRDSPTQ